MQQKDESAFYRRIMGDAFRLAWQHKHLWIFGFFATFLGFGGVYDVLFNLYERSVDSIPDALVATPLRLVPGYATVSTLMQFSPYPAVTVLLFTVFAIMVFSLFAWFTLASAGAAIGSVRKVQQGGDPHFADGIRIGADKFWTLLVITVVTKIVSFLAFFFTGINLFLVMTDRTALTAAFYIASFIAFTIVAVLAAVTSIYASCFAVIKNMDAGEALSRGWKMLKDNWLISLEMTILLFLANLGVGLLAILLFLVLAVPIVFLFLVAVLMNLSNLVTILFMLTGITAIVVVAVYASFFTTVQIAAWTLLWGDLHDKRPISKFFRLMQHLRAAPQG